MKHSWAFTELGTLLDQPWARAAEARCLNLLTRRQAVFGGGSIHALDFGYETDLAVVWTYSFLLHKFWGEGRLRAGLRRTARLETFSLRRHGSASRAGTGFLSDVVSIEAGGHGFAESPGNDGLASGVHPLRRNQRHGLDSTEGRCEAALVSSGRRTAHCAEGERR
jgi:hypothetical protein